MIFLQSCHARKDASLTVKQKQKNKKRNVMSRAEEQDNIPRSVHTSFSGCFSFDFLKCTSGVRPNANPFLRQRKPLPACLEPDLEHSPQPVRGSAHTSVSVHGERLRGRTDPARSCVLTAHAYVQHVCVSGHTGNHTRTRQKENIKLSSLKCIKVLKP